MRDSGRSEAQRHTPKLNHVATNGKSGYLNPEFEEPYMGWPFGWTSLEPLSKEEWEYFLECEDWFSENVAVKIDGKCCVVRLFDETYKILAYGFTEHSKTRSKRCESVGLGIVPQSMVKAYKILTQ